MYLAQVDNGTPRKYGMRISLPGKGYLSMDYWSQRLQRHSKQYGVFKLPLVVHHNHMVEQNSGMKAHCTTWWYLIDEDTTHFGSTAQKNKLQIEQRTLFLMSSLHSARRGYYYMFLEEERHQTSVVFPVLDPESYNTNLHVKV